MICTNKSKSCVWLYNHNKELWIILLENSIKLIAFRRQISVVWIYNSIISLCMCHFSRLIFYETVSALKNSLVIELFGSGIHQVSHWGISKFHIHIYMFQLYILSTQCPNFWHSYWYHLIQQTRVVGVYFMSGTGLVFGIREMNTTSVTLSGSSHFSWEGRREM